MDRLREEWKRGENTYIILYIQIHKLQREIKASAVWVGGVRGQQVSAQLRQRRREEMSRQV